MSNSNLINQKNTRYNGFEFLHFLVSIERDLEKIKHYFLENRENININAITKNGDTPLNLAIQQENEAIIVFLLEQGADQTIANSNCCTPLYAAVEKNNYKLVSTLLSYVDKETFPTVNVPDILGRTPLDISYEHMNTEILQILLSFEKM